MWDTACVQSAQVILPEKSILGMLDEYASVPIFFFWPLKKHDFWVTSDDVYVVGRVIFFCCKMQAFAVNEYKKKYN